MIRYFKSLIVLLFSFLAFAGVSQNETKQWYFGAQAGWDFNGPPTILTNGMMNPWEGCASIADPVTGLLLFYTDGITVWNKTHAVMANGTGLFGNSSTTQTGVIVKKPGSTTIYYIFTEDAQAAVNGLRYSTVDMSLAAGNGSVTTKNIALYTPSDEKITAVRHCNGVDVWVVTHDWNTNNFRSFLVTAAGVGAPVNTAIGTIHNGSNANTIGQMKCSPNGRKLALAIHDTPFNSFEIFDFDNATGIVSNNATLGTTFPWAYGVEFSPDGTKLYGAHYGGGNYRLYQWNMCAGTNAQIIASQYLVFTLPVMPFSIQSAANGKIYVCRYQQQINGVINSPNSLGAACNYVDLGQSTAPRINNLGLPNFITSYLKTPPPPFTYSVNSAVSCLTASFTPPPTTTLAATCSSAGFSVTGMTWTFGDPGSGPANTSTLTNPSHTYPGPGTYTAQLIINYACNADTIKVPVSIVSPSISITTTPASCSSLGSATVVASAGTGPYSYTWTPSAQTTSVATNLAAGVYTVTVKDNGGGCVVTGTANLGASSLMSGTVTSSSVTCNGAATGSATLAVTGTGPYSYTWTPTAQTTSVATNLAAGVYTVTGKDNTSGCTVTQTVLISQPPALTLAIAASSPSACVGSNITLTATGSGGTAGYTYAWTAGPPTSTYVVSQPVGGNYTYTATTTDANSCQRTGTFAVTFVNNPTLAVTNSSVCVGNTATLTASGATTYTWNPGNIIGSTYSSAPVSTTTMTVIGAIGTCSATTTAVITVNALPTPTASNTGPYCPGNTIQLNVGAFISYTWTGPSSYNSNIQNATQANAQTTNAGNYVVTVTDANGCKNTATTNVVVNPTPIVLIGSNSPVCLNNPINLTSSGGTGYSWSGPNAFSSALQNPTITPAAAVNAGVYTVTVTSLGCTNTGTVSVTVLSPTTSASNTGPYCAGATIQLNTPAATSYTWSGPSAFTSNAQNPTIASAVVGMSGTYSVLVSAGACTAFATTNLVINPLPIPAASNTGPYCPGNTIQLNVGAFTSYTWTGPSSYNSNIQNATQANAQTTNSGNYIVTVTDANGCKNTATTNVVVNPSPVIVIGSNSPVCLNFALNLTSTGGGTYNWIGPNAFTSTVQNPTIPSAATINAGVYTVTVTSLGCTSTASVNVIVTTPTTSASNTGPYCAGTTINLSAPAATSYAWNGPGGFTSTLQNPTQVNSTTLMSGTYSVIVSIGTCTASATTNVVVNALPVPVANSNSPVCAGQTINFTGLGGVTYTWTGPAYNSTTQNPSITNAVAGNAGTYSLTVTDANGCKNVATTNVVVNPLPAIAVSNPTNCVNTTINLTSNGGVTYAWTGPNTFTSNVQNPNIPSAAINMSGTYIVTVTDANGCVNTANANVSVLPLPNPNITSNSPVCAGNTLNLFGTGGATYSWSGPGYSGPTQNPTINNVTTVANGVYTLLVSSGTCTASTTFTVLINPIPVFNFSGSNVLCNGQSNGTSTVNVTVGTGPFTYQWNTLPSQTTQNATALPAGTYSCIVTDANGCTSIASTNITQPTQFSVAINSATVSACAGSPINAIANGSGGTGPYTYNWVSGPVSSLYSINESLSGNYMYTVNATDAFNCPATANINLTFFPTPTVSATSATLCNGGTTNLTASGAQTYIWQPGNITGSTYPFSGNNTTNVTVIGTSNGCSNSANTSVIVSPNPNASISASSANGCVPTCMTFTGAATTSVTSYNWTLNGASITGAQVGQYCFNEGATYSLGLSVMDANGCTGIAPPFAVNIYPAPIADFNHSPIKPIVNIDQEVVFTDASYNTPIVSWNWYFMNTAQYTSTQQNPTFSYTEPGTYVVALVVKSDKGCYDTLLRPLVVGEDFGIYVPNAFTPNADGLNDVFRPKGFGVTKYELNIYDRWGERMFHTNNFEEGWDGTYHGRGNKICEESSYTWLINCTDVFGKAHEMKGHVILMK